MPPRRVAVVGGGIAGLAAAHTLATADDPPEVVVLEASDRVGGKLRTGEVGGVRIDLGADAFLAREPDGVALCRSLGLGDDLVDQAARGVGIWWDGALRPLPDGVVLGVPTRPTRLTTGGLISPAGALRAVLDVVLPATGGAEGRSVGEVVRRRLGRAVAERLVDPLLAGVYAGDIDRLSVTAATPILGEALREHRSLILGLRRRLRASRDGSGGGGGPVFVTLRGGLAGLADRLAATSGVDVRTGVRVTSVDRTAGGYTLETARGEVPVDAVLVATPAPVAADLLRVASSDATSALSGIEYASVAVVVLVLPAGTALPTGSGILVPRATGRTIKAATWVSQKWDHVGGGEAVVVRASVGRAGDGAVVGLDDDVIVRRVREDLVRVADIHAEPRAVHVERWPDGLPQYEVGHEQRVDRVRAALRQRPGLEVAGAAFDGVGIPACIRSGQAAARRLLT